MAGNQGNRDMKQLDLFVLGTGPAATRIASKCSEAGQDVGIVDPRPFGGTCALRGCNPKKVLVRAAELLDWIRRAKGTGVRSPSEWQSGHMPNATHDFIGDLREQVPPLDRSKPVATYCASGYRASIAASLLQRAGFQDVRNVPGSWKAWTSAGYPVENGG